jgi:hypothetical protein
MKRYDFTQDIEGNTAPVELHNGMWVRWTDYQKELMQVKKKLNPMCCDCYECQEWQRHWLIDIKKWNSVFGVEAKK